MANSEDNVSPFTSEQNLERNASQILVYAPQTAFRRIIHEEVYQWCHWQPGVLFRYGSLDSPEGSEIYLGGLTVRKTLFVLVPQSLYEQRRRALLFQIVRERYHLDDNLALCRYCARLEQQKSTDWYQEFDPPVWDAEARARRVSYWVRLLASRKEQQTPEWRW